MIVNRVAVMSPHRTDGHEIEVTEGDPYGSYTRTQDRQ